MTDSYELAVVPEAALVIEPGPSNIERCRLLHHARKLVDLEFALRVKAELAGPGSKTQQQVADEIGCSLRSITRALDSIGATNPRSLNTPTGANGDLGHHDGRSFYYDVHPSAPAPVNDSEPVVDAELCFDEDEEGEPSPALAEAIARHERLMDAADHEDRVHPANPVAELVELRRALRAAVPKLRAMKDAGRELQAEALAQSITELFREVEVLLCP